MDPTILLKETETCSRMVGEIEFSDVQCLLKRFMIQVRQHVHHSHVMVANFEVLDQVSSDAAP
jgi:hypothetical protein